MDNNNQQPKETKMPKAPANINNGGQFSSGNGNKVAPAQKMNNKMEKLNKMGFGPINKEKSQKLSGSKIEPGNPFGAEGSPVGITKHKLESNRGANKRLNKMFDETNAATLGVWNNKDKKNILAKPEQVKFNPKLDKSKEVNEKLGNMGFGPKIGIDKNYNIDLLPEEEGYDYKQELLNKPERSDSDILDIQYSNPEEYDYDDIKIDNADEYKRRFSNARKALRDNWIKQGFTPEEADYVLNNWMGEEDVMLSDGFINSQLRYNEGQRNGAKKYTIDDIEDVREDEVEDVKKN